MTEAGDLAKDIAAGVENELIEIAIKGQVENRALKLELLLVYGELRYLKHLPDVKVETIKERIKQLNKELS